MDIVTDFAVLAPIPVFHLETGLTKIRDEGLEYLALGSAKIREDTSLRMLEWFRALDEACMGRPAAVLIYPSHELAEEKPPYLIEWVGLYVGHRIATSDGLHPEGWKYRPPTTRENYDREPQLERWLVYWHVNELRQLAVEQCVEIKALGVRRGIRPWPLGPEVIRSASLRRILATVDLIAKPG